MRQHNFHTVMRYSIAEEDPYWQIIINSRWRARIKYIEKSLLFPTEQIMYDIILPQKRNLASKYYAKQKKSTF